MLRFLVMGLYFQKLSLFATFIKFNYNLNKNNPIFVISDKNYIDLDYYIKKMFI